MISKQNRCYSTSLLILATAIGVCACSIMHADETEQHDSTMTADDASAEHSLPKCLDADALREWLVLAESDSTEDQAKAFELTQQPITALLDPTINRTPYHIAFRKKAKPLVGRLMRLLEHSDEWIVEEALSWLYDIGPGASECAPELKTYFGTCDPSRRALVVQTLLSVTPEDTPVGPFVLKQLSRYLKELTVDELSRCHLKLTSKQQEDGTTVEYLDGQQAMGFGITAAGYAIVLAGTGHTRSELPYLLKAASVDYPNYYRATAIIILGEFGDEARDALPDLWKLLDDQDPIVRQLAANAILLIEHDVEIIEPLADRLQLTEDERRRFEEDARETVETEERIWNGGAEILEEEDAELNQMLLAQLQYGNGFSRRNGLRFLKRARGVNKSFLPVLRELAEHKDQTTRKLAQELLDKNSTAQKEEMPKTDLG